MTLNVRFHSQKVPEQQEQDMQSLLDQEVYCGEK